MTNHNSKPDNNRLKTLLLIVLCLLVVLGIVYMKRSTQEVKQAAPGTSPAAAGSIAIPDTTLDASALPETTDTPDNACAPDTILGTDTRVPYEAGYEDGYEAGCEDGANNAEKASYDETSNFQTPKQRENYAIGYREGYAKGLEDGKAGKQFNI